MHTINFQNILGTTLVTEKGHLDQERKKLQFTQQLQNDDLQDFFPKSFQDKTNETYTTIITAVK